MRITWQVYNYLTLAWLRLRTSIQWTFLLIKTWEIFETIIRNTAGICLARVTVNVQALHFEVRNGRSEAGFTLLVVSFCHPNFIYLLFLYMLLAWSYNGQCCIRRSYLIREPGPLLVAVDVIVQYCKKNINNVRLCTTCIGKKSAYWRDMFSEIVWNNYWHTYSYFRWFVFLHANTL